MDILKKYNEQKDKSGTGVQFEKNRIERSYYSETPKIIQWVMKYSGGLVKDEKQASYVLIGFAAVVVIVTSSLIFGGDGTTVKYTPVPITGREFEDVNWPPIPQ